MTPTPNAHAKGCRCFLCEAERQGIAQDVRRIAGHYNVTPAALGESGRSPDARTGAARQDLAVAMREKGWALNAIATLMGVDRRTVRYWLGDRGSGK